MKTFEVNLVLEYWLLGAPPKKKLNHRRKTTITKSQEK